MQIPDLVTSLGPGAPTGPAAAGTLPSTPGEPTTEDLDTFAAELAALVAPGGIAALEALAALIPTAPTLVATTTDVEGGTSAAPGIAIAPAATPAIQAPDPVALLLAGAAPEIAPTVSTETLDGDAPVLTVEAVVPTTASTEQAVDEAASVAPDAPVDAPTDLLREAGVPTSELNPQPGETPAAQEALVPDTDTAELPVEAVAMTTASTEQTAETVDVTPIAPVDPMVDVPMMPGPIDAPQPTRVASDPAPAPAPVPPARLGQALLDALSQMRSRGETTHRLVVRLDPPELGAVHLHLVAHGDDVHLSLSAETPGARAALEGQRDAVQRALGAEGFDLSSFDVAGEGRRWSGTDANGNPTRRAGAEDEPADELPTATPTDGALRL